MLQFDIVPTCELLCLETNHTTDVMKAIVHTVDMKVRKLKKNNVRNTNKVDNLSKNCSNHITI